MSSDTDTTVDLRDENYDPTKSQKIEMRKARKRPSEWLRWLCKDWAEENSDLAHACDETLYRYKPYLKGMLTSQELCRLSMPCAKLCNGDSSNQGGVDLWGKLGIEDDFDKNYIIAQVDRFCVMYDIRGTQVEIDTFLSAESLSNADPTALAAAAAAVVQASAVAVQNGVVQNGSTMLSASRVLTNFTGNTTNASTSNTPSSDYDDTMVMKTNSDDTDNMSPEQTHELMQAQRVAKDAEKALENERRQNIKREHKRQVSEKREQKARDREIQAIRKAAERAAKEAIREDKRKRQVEKRVEREKFAQDAKEAALNRAAELVESNRVPIEITRGATAVKVATVVAATTTQRKMPPPPENIPFAPPAKRQRSAIVVSTASDLDRIVTHSKNLWVKYNAVAKEHNQKVNWVTVAKELGIHVKVREKYARMHSRAVQRGFDWVKYGDWKIKDHPEIFSEPTLAEQKAKMPPPPLSETQTVVIGENKESSDEAAAAVAAAVVDASVNSPPIVDTVVQTTDEHSATAAAAAVAANLVADPTVSTTVSTVSEQV